MTMIRQLIDLTAPDYCCNCLKIGDIICDSCKHDITCEPFGRCLVCGSPSQSSQLCANCRGGISDAWVVGERSETLEKLIDISKFDSNRRGCTLQAELLDACLPTLPLSTIVVPIPTIRRHVRQRGYGHMELVSRQLSLRRGWEVRQLLVRNNNTVQHGASKKTRQIQAKRAFSLSTCAAIDRPILLIDDVYTTGATIHAAVEQLLSVTDLPIYVAVTSRQLLD